MAKPFRDLREKMSPARRARNATLTLGELRVARGITQPDLARAMQLKQPAISRMESRADVLVSTLRAAVEAMGGRLEMRAVFEDGSGYGIRLSVKS